MDDRTFDRRQDALLSPVPEHISVGPDPRLSRRRLLGGATGGFVLAASGLLVPEGVTGVERKRPVERILNDHRERNRKNRNRRDRNDNNRNRKDRDANDRQGFPRVKDVELVFISGKSLNHELEVWQIGGTEDFPVYTLKWPRQKVPAGRQNQRKFTGSNSELVMVLFTPISVAPLYFQAWNAPVFSPHLKVAHGSWDRHGAVNPGHVYFDHGMDVGERANVPGFYVDRGGDGGDHKIFVINATD